MYEYENYYIDFMTNRNKGNFEIDGAINMEEWKKSKYKILFVLKETAGYKDCRTFYLKDELKDTWLQYKQKQGNRKIQNPTYKFIAWLAKSIQIALVENRLLSNIEINKLDTGPESLIEAIEHCAIINVKKHSNPQKNSVDDDIYIEYLANKELLKLQIKELSPNIVFAGSSIVWKCLSDKNNGLYNDILTSTVKKFECKTFNGIIFYHANHPSAYGKHKMDKAKIHKQLFEEIKRSIG